MKTISNTKKTLISSFVSLSMLVSTMILGGTFAMFTSQAKNEGNKIQSGILDVQLLKANAQAESGWDDLEEVDDPIFELTNFFPGDEYETTLRIINCGTIDIQYNLTLEDLKSDEALQEVLDIYVDNIWKAPLDRFQNSGSLKSGVLAPASVVDLDVKVVFYEGAGNEYQNLEVSPFDVLLHATQLKNQMSINNVSPDGVVRAAVAHITTSTTEAQLNAGAITAILPEETVSGLLDETSASGAEVVFSAEVVSDNSASFTIGSGTDEIITFDFSLLVNEQPVTTFGETAGVPNEIKITQFITPGLPVVKVVYYAEDGTPEILRSTYDCLTGELSFWTSHFSRFVVECEVDAVVRSGQSIQAAIINAQVGDTIFVEPGLYAEYLEIGKPLTLLGNNYDVKGQMPRHDETIITVPGGENAEVFFGKVNIDVTSSDVVIKGFTITGDNEEVKSIWTQERQNAVYNGATIAEGSSAFYSSDYMSSFIGKDIGVDGSVGIYVCPVNNNTKIEGVIIENNIISDYWQLGVYIYGRQVVNHASATVKGNLVSDILALPFLSGGKYAGHYGRAVAYDHGATGLIEDNKFVESTQGIHVQGAASRLVTIERNEFENTNTGIWLNSSTSLVSTITDNNFHFTEDFVKEENYITKIAQNNAAIIVTSLEQASNIMIARNNISGYNYGVAVAGVPLASTVSILENTFTNINTACVYIPNYIMSYAFSAVTKVIVGESNHYGDALALKYDVFAAGIITIVTIALDGTQSTQVI